MTHARAHLAEPRLMIVDDDPGTIRLLAEILKGLGKIHFTTSGAEAVAMARALRPDIILLDVEMPDADGLCICESIKGDPSFEDVPVLFVTSHGELTIETRALAVGAIDFISKPPHPPIVRARVQNYLALKHRTDELRRLSTVDGLTGVANRRAFDAALDMEWRRACRT
ncbi:MAG: response regulator, partial [Rhizobiales bacterium]|nr:response regulator [Hyphomicrobiales bacterium]